MSKATRRQVQLINRLEALCWKAWSSTEDVREKPIWALRMIQDLIRARARLLRVKAP